MKKAVIFSVIFTFGIFFLMPISAWASTVYVNESGDDSNSGTSDEPFKTLEKAAEEVNDGDADEIKIAKGKYSGNTTFENKVSIQGAGKSSTTLTGTLTFKKNADLRNFSVHTKGANAITLGKGSVGDFKDLDIRDFTGVGIWITSGSGSLRIEDSRIGGSGGKGIYAESGTKLNISGSTIVNNKQEGLDIRQNTRGEIKNNTIENNSESGIELIVGSSDFYITGNSIKKNGASGIAFQFYSLNKKSGAIVASGNTISGSRKFGIDCNKPQSGKTPVGYWADSISLEGNTLSNNGDDISTSCKLIEAKTEEEEKALQAELEEEQKKLAEAARLAALTQAQKEEEERKRQEEESTRALVGEAEGVVQSDSYNSILTSLENQNKYRKFFLGAPRESVDALRIQISEDEVELSDYKNRLSVLPTYQSQADLQARIVSKEEELKAYQQKLESFENQKGFFKSIPVELKNRINRIVYVLPF